MTAYWEALHQHLHRYFNGHPCEIRRWNEGKAWNLVEDEEFHVVEFGPGPRTDRWSYVSVGCGTVRPNRGRRIEFILCSREQSDRHVEVVELAALHHLNGQTLDVGHTLPIGQPWLPGATLDHLLVTLPYPFGPTLEQFHSGQHHARLLWLVPIAGCEAQLTQEKGLDALESRLESSGIDYADPMRTVVSGERGWWKRWLTPASGVPIASADRKVSAR